MENTTRICISRVSQRREVVRAKSFSGLRKGKSYIRAMIRDGLKSYDEAFQKVSVSELLANDRSVKGIEMFLLNITIVKDRL